MECYDGKYTYEVRLRFCRARGLLSTSGGILFATVSGECTRNAKSVVAVHDGLARLPGLDATGSGDEGTISNNNGFKANEQETKVSTFNWHGTSREIVGNDLVAGNE
jgi:hypothetical protein